MPAALPRTLFRAARSARPWLAMALLLPFARVARAEMRADAAPVVEHYLAATGGRDARANEHTQHFKGRIEAEGLTGSWELWVAEPDRWMRTMHLGPLHFREGFDGTTAWRTDLSNKGVIALAQAAVEDAHEEGWFLNERWALAGEDSGTIRLASRSYREDVQYDELDITPPHGTTRRMSVNAKTGFIERVTSTEDQHTSTDRLGEYRMLGGRKRPSVFSAPTLLPSDRPIERMRVDSAWVNVPVDSARFSPPAVPERKIAWRAAAHGLRVPFTYGTQTVLVKASINGAPPADFILDTGASLTALDSDYAQSIGLTPEGDAAVQGISASAGMRFARVGSMALCGASGANATLKDFRVALVELTEGSQILLWRKPAGLLGADFLRRFVVTIDYDSNTVTLNDPETFAYSGHGAALPFELDQGIPAVDMTIEGRCTGKFIVDVGNSFHLMVHGSMVRSCGLIGEKKRPEVEVEGGGLGGGFVSTLCRLDSVRLGPYVWSNAVAALALHKTGGIGSVDYAGNIGNDVLEKFKVTLDYSRSTLYLEPGARFGKPERVSRFGALLARIGTRVVAGSVLSGSAAAEAGLRWYDEIVAIDGRPLEDWTREEVDRVLEEGELGSVHHVTYRRLDDAPTTVEVTLKDAI